MWNKWYSCRPVLPAETDMRARNPVAPLLVSALLSAAATPVSFGAEAPGWMHALVGATVPVHDEKANAVLMYSDNRLTVRSDGKISRLERRAYLILRPDGESWGTVRVDFDPQSPVTGLRGWCIPPAGKDFAVKEWEAMETALPGVENGALVTDTRAMILRVPAAQPGNIVGYEIEQEQRPYMLVDEWLLQSTLPVREARYSVQLPPGWSYKATWINHTEIAPTPADNGQWSWTATNLAAVRLEDSMPPWRGVAARMVLSLIPPNRPLSALLTWKDVGLWQANLVQGRDIATTEIKQRVAELVTGKAALRDRVRALAGFVQREIRYVGIELGIGGFQPHTAADVFQHRYGDCKDKATLLHAMLNEIGVKSYYVVINTVRGNITTESPPNLGFNHQILAIQLPVGQSVPEWRAALHHPSLGTLVFFDPTNELTPLGYLAGALQANVGMLVTPDGGELITLPQMLSDSSSISRSGRLTLDSAGALHGEMREVRTGDAATQERLRMLNLPRATDRVRPLEGELGNSLSNFQIVKASVGGLSALDQPVEWHYTLEVEQYAKSAGELLLVRPRVLGIMSNGLLETKEPRENPIELPGPEIDSDNFEIGLPDGYEIDELPPAVSADYEFATYHSQTAVAGRTLRYTRTLEIRQLTIPVSRAEDMKTLNRLIWNDERRTAVLRPIAH
jgi:transglutaminase-like putative cysteine protease